MEKDFNRERVLIGQGKMAKVYLWNGFAYKCYEDHYPEEWISYEIGIQGIINSTDLRTVKYYESEIPHSIKMDYIDGVSLASRVLQDKYKESIDDLLSIIEEVHRFSGLNLSRLSTYLHETIMSMDIDGSIKEKAGHYITDLPEDNVLCHLDFHFLNLMYAEGEYYIIDWINARNGNPIYDYARSYVILHEYAYRLSKKFLKRVKNQCGFKEIDFQKAVYVMAVHRLSEHTSDKTRQLMEHTDSVLSALLEKA